MSTNQWIGEAHFIRTSCDGEKRRSRRKKRNKKQAGVRINCKTEQWRESGRGATGREREGGRGEERERKREGRGGETDRQRHRGRQRETHRDFPNDKDETLKALILTPTVCSQQQNWGRIKKMNERKTQTDKDTERKKRDRGRPRFSRRKSGKHLRRAPGKGCENRRA